MNTITKVDCGIKPLETVLNRMVSAINRRTVDTGVGLVKSETETGILISLANRDERSGGAAQTGGGSATIAWQGVKWIQVNVVDANCNQSTITVLSWTGNAADTVTVGPIG